ncbi:MAG: biopolymer transporter ExbD, partial [Mariprofundales bacterium]|nr:biopolymer transporter ExbD [Mariprofundales bacterium]
MWSGEGRWSSDQDLMGEINVTPFVDVMLVLLIIFMVTAPLLTQGVDVDLPSSAATDLSQSVEPMVISIKRDGSIFMQKRQVVLTQLLP